MTEDPYLRGELLWGDDFDESAIAGWFEREREAYANLGASEGTAESYGYHGLNTVHGFRHLPVGRFEHALGIGSAYGGEFLPVRDRIGDLTIVEPSSQLHSKTLGGLPVRYVDPQQSGQLPFGDSSFDLVLCLGVLHHIPNVSVVVNEIGRVTSPGGWCLLREPIISLGDWTKPRKPGVTADERGIPRAILRRLVNDAGFEIRHESLCVFPLANRLGERVSSLSLDRVAGARLDAVLSRVFSWNYRYHAESAWMKVRPTSSFLVLRRSQVDGRRQ